MNSFSENGFHHINKQLSHGASTDQETDHQESEEEGSE
jgi:hypothetical protein